MHWYGIFARFLYEIFAGQNHERATFYLNGKEDDMRERARHTVLWMVIIAAAICFPTAPAAADSWLDQLTTVLADHRNFARSEGREAAYEPYLAQLNVARSALDRGDVEGVYAAMNRFMDMLEYVPEAAGIPLWSAKALFDYCAEVTPPMYHDLSRHGTRKTT